MNSAAITGSRSRSAFVAGAVALISAATAWLVISLCPSQAGTLAAVAWCCATLSLFWSLGAALIGVFGSDRSHRCGLNTSRQAHAGDAARGRNHSRHDATQSMGEPATNPPPSASLRSDTAALRLLATATTINPRPLRQGFTAAFQAAALLFGVAAAMALAVILLTRFIYVGVDLLNGFPWQDVRRYGFDAMGLWSLGLLFSSCATALLSTGDPRLYTCQLWCSVSIGAWGCLLVPSFRVNDSGVQQPTGSTILLAACLSLLLIVAGWLGIWLDRRRGPRRESTINPPGEGRDASWPGFRMSCGAIAIVTMLLSAYHLAVPVRSNDGGFALGTLAITGIASMAAYAMWLLARRSGRSCFADAGFGFVTLACGGLAVTLLPAEPSALAARYPMIFNALMAGFAAAAGFLTYLRARWRRRAAAGTADVPVYLPGSLRRAVFLSLSLALILASLAACWPRLPSISAMDDSLGRVTAGTAANLLLVWVMFRVCGVMRGVTFRALLVLSLLATGGFLVVRLLPFTPQYG